MLADAHNFGSETKKAAGTPLYMSLGQSGSILGSHLFPSTEGPRYVYVLSPLCARCIPDHEHARLAKALLSPLVYCSWQEYRHLFSL